jgi:hypothetical protein
MYNLTDKTDANINTCIANDSECSNNEHCVDNTNGLVRCETTSAASNNQKCVACISNDECPYATPKC